ncbi:molybdopterin synthase sulfur carrier subunit [Amylibacter ulvae]|uniref:Molybdopterin synthase sulfur carrier subunit n=1 Tax=Paramylibacter ulvae TaxID=1651968 RepID=A0ABQ3D8D6_9RHOB|nr:molybdopterin converting factor subunit 1 [Amylibacter ulvae]GHA58062.1 molybdopterin synthase sulfur carrier subunit [Amylibacter ulvae]
MKLNVLYFAWVRERIGVASETVETDAGSINELLDELSAREERYAIAFSDRSVLRCAIDQTLVPFETSLANATEVAFFPPMTGG